jgi:hypothetical protein
MKPFGYKNKEKPSGYIKTFCGIVAKEIIDR